MSGGTFRDFLVLAGRSIAHRKIRSWLTVIGIFIGITAVVALISIGLSLQSTMTGQVGKIFGYNTFVIFGQDPFSQQSHSSMGAFQLDLGTVKAVEGVVAVAAVREESGFVVGPEKKGLLPVMGLSPELATEFRSFLMDQTLEKGGRFFQSGDGERVILGGRIAQRLGATLGSTLEIQDRPFEVIGVLTLVEGGAESSRGGMGGGFSVGTASADDTLYVPFEVMDSLFGPSDTVLLTLVKTADGANVDEVADRVETTLHDLGNEDAVAVTYTDISKQIGTIMGAVSAFLAGLAGISLLVGGVGVMNTMYTSVLERTREIGVMKAIGATNGHVLAIFLIESGLMGLVGGIVGAGLGVGLSVVAGALIRRFVEQVEFVTVISPGLIAATLLFSFFLGAVAGLLPARRAAKLPPVDALRYE
jgi:putative ABC transport system permease protein